MQGMCLFRDGALYGASHQLPVPDDMLVFGSRTVILTMLRLGILKIISASSTPEPRTLTFNADDIDPVAIPTAPTPLVAAGTDHYVTRSGQYYTVKFNYH